MKCDKCGKFININSAVTYTEYSGASEFEPREPIYLHQECYDRSDKELINRTAWIKPHILGSK
jgi:hypothetical protein